MADPPADRDDEDARVGAIEFSVDFEPNTLVYDAYTASPPRLLDSAALGAPPAPASRPAAGALSRVAHFKILGKIGEGGMGVVYRANDEYLQRLVALKVLTVGKDGNDDAENTQRLLREARAASRIAHPNVVTVYAAGETDGHPFIAMEFVEGEELGKLIGPEGLDTARALDIAAQVSEGLGAAHAQGIVHRDIKPANVLVCAGDRVKILDFGLAKPGGVLPAPGSGSLRSEADLPDSIGALDFYNTQAGVIWGSLRYMSPEQFTGDALDARSDVFSLGIVLYQMLTGTLPFVSKSPRGQLAVLLRHEPTPIRQLRLRVPEAVEKIVDRALSRDRDFRYPNGDALAADLRTALRRLRELGDVEIEDAAAGARSVAGVASGAAPRPDPSARPEPAPEAERPRQISVGVDTVTFFPPGSQFDAVILSPHVYPWSPRGSQHAGSTAAGTAVGVLGETYEVVAADQQRANLNRYFLARWTTGTIIRRVAEYSPELVGRHAALGRERDAGSKPIGSVITNIFGKRRRDG
jgi:serine/threonine protein kinase